MKSVILLGLMAFASQGLAAGGYHCDANDSKISFEVSGGLSHGMPGLPFSNQGQIQFKDKNQASFSIANVAKNMIAGFWQDSVDFKIMFYSEDYPGEHSQMVLRIDTKRIARPSGDDEYVGRYTATTNSVTQPQIEISGSVRCSIE